MRGGSWATYQVWKPPLRDWAQFSPAAEKTNEDKVSSGVKIRWEAKVGVGGQERWLSVREQALLLQGTLDYLQPP